MKIKFCKRFAKSVYEMIKLYRIPEELQHNVAISIEHDAFKVIQRYLDKTDLIYKKRYNSYEALCYDILRPE